MSRSRITTLSPNAVGTTDTRMSIARPATRTRYVSVAPGETTEVDFTGSGTLTGVLLDAGGNPLGDVIVIMPPLSITEGELEELLETIYQSIKMVIAA